MNIFILTVGVLLLNFTHLTSAIIGLRDAMMDHFGRKKFLVVYAIDSTIAMGLIIYGYYQRDFTDVYQPPVWGAEFNKGAMFLAFWLVCGQFFNGWFKQFIKAPAVAGIGVWAFGHLCANGDLHSVILFGGFLIYAIIGLYYKLQRPALDREFHYKGDIKAFFIGFVIYVIIGLGHPYFTGISVF